MKIGRGIRSTRRKPAPAPLCPPQIPLDQNRDRTRTNRLSYDVSGIAYDTSIEDRRLKDTNVGPTAGYSSRSV
jgi:hypothetical protein